MEAIGRIDLVLPKVLPSQAVQASPIFCKSLKINVCGHHWTAKRETSVLSVELRGRLIINDLRHKHIEKWPKFYQKFYFVSSYPQPFTGVLVSQVCLWRNDPGMVESSYRSGLAAREQCET